MRSGSGCPLLPCRKRGKEGVTSDARAMQWLRSDGVWSSRVESSAAEELQHASCNSGS